MIVNVVWNITPPSRLEDVFFLSLLQTAVEQLSLSKSCTPEAVSVVFVDRSHIQSLNRRYRNLSQETDVLSFSTENLNGDLGDIVIAPEVIADEVGAWQGAAFEMALAQRVVHGFLHLLGYDHTHHDHWDREIGSKRGMEMAALTDRILDISFS